jgi:hypothetical protein
MLLTRGAARTEDPIAQARADVATLRPDADLTFTWLTYLAPGGGALAYFAGTQIYAGRDGAVARALAPGLGPSWSPSGQRFAYAGPPFNQGSAHGGGPGGILMVANADGSGARSVGMEPFYPGWQPAVWSADERRIAAGERIYDVDSGAVVARAARPGWRVGSIELVTELAAILHLEDNGRFVIWRVMRRYDDLGGLTQWNQFVAVDANGAEQLLARSDELSCVCLGLARQLVAVWSPRGNAVALAGQFLGANVPEVRFYETNGNQNL